MQKRENGVVKVVNAANLTNLETDATTATGSLDLYPGDVNSRHYVLTNDLSGNVSVGLNVRNARKGMVARVVRNSATPGAVTVTVKSGTAGAGTTIHRAIAASKNGFVEAKFDGTNWIGVGFSEHT